MPKLDIPSLLPVLSDATQALAHSSHANTTYVGVDFGTSTTVASICTLQADGQLLVKPIELRQKLEGGNVLTAYKVPSVVAWHEGKLLFGQGAANLKVYKKYGVNMWHSFKMGLGEDVGCKYPSSELSSVDDKYKIVNPKDATFYFFKYLNLQIKKYVESNGLPKNIKYAFSIPASFEANQRRDLLQCLAQNGIDVSNQSLIDEPNAAFLSYVSNNTNTANAIQIPDNYDLNVLVFDFGAGTCDVSILEVGLDHKGVYSKNIAISEFKQLGGDDVDRLIAVDVLLPALLSSSEYTIQDFRRREITMSILPKLLPFAERLKVLMNDQVSKLLDNSSMEALMQRGISQTLGHDIKIETSKGELSISNPSITLEELTKVYDIFTRANHNRKETRLDKMLNFESVFSPIDSALNKVQLNRGDIDYVLFIGGSAKSPFIQRGVSKGFPDAEKVIPSDLQAHVSAGAAIHSLIFNGYGKNVISPITSEPILIAIKDGFMERLEPLVPAGSSMPSDIMPITGLRPQKDGQVEIQVPIFVGNKNKMLFNLKVPSIDHRGYTLSDSIDIYGEVSADKVLNIRARHGDRSIEVEPLNPFLNKEMTTEDRIAFAAERAYNLAVKNNGGKPTSNDLWTLIRVYEKIHFALKAAETYDLLEDLYPGKGNLNNQALQLSNAGRKDQAMQLYKKANEVSPSATTCFNIAMQYKYTDQGEYLKYLEKAMELDPDHNHSLYSLGTHYKTIDQEKSEQLLQQAFDNWNEKYQNGNMRDYDYSWFSSCARALGQNEYADEIEKAGKEEVEKLFDVNSLATKNPTSNDKLLK